MPTHIRALTPTAEGTIIAPNTEIKKRLLSLFYKLQNEKINPFKNVLNIFW